MTKWLHRLRGALGNAALWAGVWALATVPVLGILQVLGLGEIFGVLPLAPRIAGILASMGFVAGGAFSTYLSIAPPRHLADLDLRVVGVVGALFAGAMVPLFPFLPALISILGVPFPAAVAGAIAVAGVLGGATAAGSVKVAQTAALGSGGEPTQQLGAHTEVVDGRPAMLPGPDA